MALKTIRARAAKGTENIDLLVQKARTQAGVERILVVYDEKQTAHIYVEGEPAPKSRHTARAS